MKQGLSIILSIIFPCVCHSQESLLSIFNERDYEFIKISNTPHLFVGDSVYVFNNQSVDAFKSNRLDFINILNVKDSIFKAAGGGSIYKLNSKYDLDKVVEKKTMEKSFFKSAVFIRNDTLFQFGGYGNFSNKNHLIYYDRKLKSWEFYNYSEQNILKPSAGAPQFFFYNNEDDKFYVAGIYGESSIGRQNDYLNLNTVWAFSFKTKTWSSIGDFSFMNQFNDRVYNFYKNDSLYIGRSDFNNLLIVNLQDLNWRLVNDISNINRKLRGIIFNDDFVYIINKKSDIELQILRYKRSEVIGKLITKGDIIENNNYSLTYYLFGVLVLSILILLNKIRKKNINLQKKLLKFKLMKYELLSLNEIRLLDDLLESNINEVSFKKINSYFDPNLNFETIKVKTRKLISDLNLKLEKEINIKNSLVIERSVNDRRARVVKIKK